MGHTQAREGAWLDEGAWGGGIQATVHVYRHSKQCDRRVTTREERESPRGLGRVFGRGEQPTPRVTPARGQPHLERRHNGSTGTNFKFSARPFKSLKHSTMIGVWYLSNIYRGGASLRHSCAAFSGSVGWNEQQRRKYSIPIIVHTTTNLGLEQRGQFY